MRTCHCFLALLMVSMSASIAPAETVPWHHPLYLAAGGYWRSRVAVTVHNFSGEAMEGRPVAVRIGAGRGQLALGQAPAEAIRVVDSAGVEMLYSLSGPDGKAIVSGPVPPGSMLVLPVECRPGGSATRFVYFDNPAAAAVPDFLEVKPGLVGGAASLDEGSPGQPEAGKLRVETGPLERLSLAEVGETPTWHPLPAGGSAGQRDHRAAVKVFHFAEEPAEQALVRIHASMIRHRMRGRLDPESLVILDSGKPVEYWAWGDSILFATHLAPRSVRTLYVYFGEGPEFERPWKESGVGLPGGRANLVKNPGFESGEPMPDGWTHTEPGKAEGVTLTVGAPGRDGPGSRCVRMHVPHDAPKAWRGWRQAVSVKPGRSYLLAACVRTEDVRGGQVRLHAHLRTADGSLCAENAFNSAGEPIGETTDWTLLSGVLEMPKDAARLDLHLTMDATGTVWHDGVLVAEVVPGEIVRFEGRLMPPAEPLAAWPVPAVEKVFQDTPAPSEIPPAEISLARNEKEPLQLAIRSGRSIKDVEIVVDGPVGPGGARLDGVEVGVAGYVPIDHPTSYYRSESPAWHRKYPTRAGSCDGWPGMWPDPLLPRTTIDLEPNATQAVWVTVAAAPGTPPGDYHGSVRFRSFVVPPLGGTDRLKPELRTKGRILAEVPFRVHVWDFALPEQSHVAAIYDVRFGPGGGLWGSPPDEMYDPVVDLMARNRLCPDAVRPDPEFRYEDGRVVADFAAFDRAAERYFGDLGLPFSYTPRIFYLFGWGHPPKSFFGQRPYPGEPPYEGVDRSRLRPEYKRAYQACLKTFWDHLKEKGWDKKFVLYISDEPHFRHRHIVEQMQALSEMIHEVDPQIPIYSSTWSHLPEWDGCLDVWGISHYGRVPVDEMAAIRNRGGRIWFTTDGQMCTDTPYCAVERLLPHYCFQYGAEAYEFWGVAWLTYDPYRFGWHAYIRQSSEPGQHYWVRYPNGDGFLLYPGDLPGTVPVPSIRFEHAREGVEDYEYLYLLRSLVAKAKASGRDASAGEKALERASRLVAIPNAGGRWSSQILPDPAAVYEVRRALAEAIEELQEATEKLRGG